VLVARQRSFAVPPERITELDEFTAAVTELREQRSWRAHATPAKSH
jgi:hypothetical protein